MIKISLIQTSQNRRVELLRFVRSLNQQENIDFSEVQLIFVDQENNRDVFDDLNKNVMFDYIQTNHCSLSHARNLALPHVKGKYVAFPDDDCWYEPDTLFKALEILGQNNFQGVTGRGLNENNLPTSKFPDKAAVLTKTKRCAAISYTMFFLYVSSVFFDEDMGVGSPYNLGSGEETDYMLTLMEKYKYKIKYNPQLIVHHPRQDDIYEQSFMLKKHYSYARGAGYLMQKHKFSLNYYLRHFGRPILGILGYTIKCDEYKSKKSYYILKGRIEGYMYKKEG